MNIQKIGNFIYENRKKKKLTQEELAEKLGVTNRTISRWETGKCMPDMSLYDALCKELDITINELLTGEKINNDNYQQTFEKNIINVVNEVETKVKKNNIIIKIIVTTLLTLIVIFLLLAFYQSFYFTEKYSEKDMKIGKSPDNTLLLQTNQE